MKVMVIGVTGRAGEYSINHSMPVFKGCVSFEEVNQLICFKTVRWYLKAGNGFTTFSNASPFFTTLSCPLENRFVR